MLSDTRSPRLSWTRTFRQTVCGIADVTTLALVAMTLSTCTVRDRDCDYPPPVTQTYFVTSTELDGHALAGGTASVTPDTVTVELEYAEGGVYRITWDVVDDE